ncbi:hypothetical protein [Nostoc sp. FACHB-110]|nr:hypothetical protein [Nostoc sp. FACHB-110]
MLYKFFWGYERSLPEVYSGSRLDEVHSTPPPTPPRVRGGERLR